MRAGKVTLHISAVDEPMLRKIVATCSQERESIGADWAPRVMCEGPELFGVDVLPCTPALAALLCSIADAGGAS